MFSVNGENKIVRLIYRGFRCTEVRYVEVPLYNENSIDFLHLSLTHFVDVSKWTPRRKVHDSRLFFRRTVNVLENTMWCDVMWCDVMWHTARYSQATFQEVVILRYFRTHAALSSKKYPVVITQGRIFIGGVVVNSSKANILDALWEITLAWAWVRLAEVKIDLEDVLKERLTAADSAKAFKLYQTLF